MENIQSGKFWLGICSIMVVGVLLWGALLDLHERRMTKEANIHREEMLLIESKMIGEVYNIGPIRGR